MSVQVEHSGLQRCRAPYQRRDRTFSALKNSGELIRPLSTPWTLDWSPRKMMFGCGRPMNTVAPWFLTYLPKTLARPAAQHLARHHHRLPASRPLDDP